MNKFILLPILLMVLSCQAQHTPKESEELSHKHTNRLAKSSSPYLLQHQHNPVNWYEWGEEALEKAKKENKPLIISIGLKE